jgi:hypothetical protein
MRSSIRTRPLPWAAAVRSVPLRQWRSGLDLRSQLGKLANHSLLTTTFGGFKTLAPP